MAKGGKRPGAGRKPNVANKLVHDALHDAAPKLIKKAISMGMAGDRVILAALLRKIAPDLQAITVDGSMSVTHSFSKSDAEIDKELSAYYAERRKA